jgi:4-hydroxythreonine-4-phosphate dehydrogenase
MSAYNDHKPIIGFSCGDLNGIGLETIIKTLSDSRILDFCTPVIFANNKVINFYRKTLPEMNMNLSAVKDKDLSKINHKQISFNRFLILPLHPI